MLRLFILTLSMLSSCIAQANSTYQIDLILFSYPHAADKSNNFVMNSPLIPISKSAIPLKTDAAHSYGLLPPSQSGLHDEYYLLSRKSQFKVLANYSWKQPVKNLSSIALPNTELNGWLIQGTVKVLKGTFYQLDAELQLSPPDDPEASFVVSQKQRLKENTVYFLDHPQIGMLVKIHQLA
jgi:hypothetical protein